MKVGMASGKGGRSIRWRWVWQQVTVCRGIRGGRGASDEGGRGISWCQEMASGEGGRSGGGGGIAGECLEVQWKPPGKDFRSTG